MLNVLFSADTTVMRMMQNTFNLIQNYTKRGAMTGFDTGPQVMKQRFDFAPMDVAADRILKDDP
jgi:hypothetical protein